MRFVDFSAGSATVGAAASHRIARTRKNSIHRCGAGCGIRGRFLFRFDAQCHVIYGSVVDLRNVVTAIRGYEDHTEVRLIWTSQCAKPAEWVFLFFRAKVYVVNCVGKDEDVSQ